VLLVGWSRCPPAGSPPPLSDGEARMVSRILSGEAQKSVANDLGVAPSTTSRRYRQARRALGLETRGLPLTVVLAAQSWTKVSELPEARSGSFELEGRAFVTLSVPRPVVRPGAGLTDAQQDAAAMLIAGLQPREIAARRFISVHTALRHVHAVYRKLNATGRYALIRRAAGSGWFR
jgi:DNA-binding CsgD family transcriptional regulator